LETNALEKDLPLDDDKTLVLSASESADKTAQFDAIKSANDFRKDFDVLFTTYNQMQTVARKDTARRGLLSRLASDAVFSFDESHEAGGQGKKQRKKKGDAENRSEFARGLIARAKGVFYSSATYAKRPDVMDLYAATDMAMAVADKEDLGEAIAKGGVPMQQV